MEANQAILTKHTKFQLTNTKPLDVMLLSRLIILVGDAKQGILKYHKFDSGDATRITEAYNALDSVASMNVYAPSNQSLYLNQIEPSIKNRLQNLDERNLSTFDDALTTLFIFIAYLYPTTKQQNIYGGLTTVKCPYIEQNLVVNNGDKHNLDDLVQYLHKVDFQFTKVGVGASVPVLQKLN